MLGWRIAAAARVVNFRQRQDGWLVCHLLCSSGCVVYYLCYQIRSLCLVFVVSTLGDNNIWLQHSMYFPPPSYSLQHKAACLCVFTCPIPGRISAFCLQSAPVDFSNYLSPYDECPLQNWASYLTGAFGLQRRIFQHFSIFRSNMESSFWHYYPCIS